MYTYTLGGKNGRKVSLHESNDRIVVRTRNARRLTDAIFLDESRDALADFNVESEIPEADVTVLKTKEGISDDLSSRDTARTALKKEPELRFAGRVLVDEESETPVLYTENIFIKFFDTVSADDCERILEENNLTIKQKTEFANNSYFVQAPENTGLKIFELADSLLQLEEVELCHPEVVRKLAFKAIHLKQWHLAQATINGQLINAHVKADLAHQLSQGENIVIAVIDDGVDIDHAEFMFPGKVVDSRDATLNTNDPRPKSASNNHGTACAGVAVASGANAPGVAPQSKLMPIRLRSWLGSMNEANAFKWAVDHGADIISCSWGPEDGDWSWPADPLHKQMVMMSDSTRLAIEDAVTRGRNGKGCVIFFAAGNGNEDIKYDGYASFDKVIAVAACNDTNRRSVYSDYGDAVWCAFPSNDFGYLPFNHPAPLTRGIYTSDRSGQAGYNANGNYTDNFGGTSSACPGAAGVAALILSAYPDLTWQQVRNIFRQTSEKIDAANGQYDEQGHSKKYGYGKIDAQKAVLMALEMKANHAAVQKQVRIFSALVNPPGIDAGREKLSLMNTSATEIDLTGWAINIKGKKQVLSTTLPVGQTISIELKKSVRLSNTGSTIVLMNNQQEVVDSVTYRKDQVEKGEEIQF